jgi:hypothetical protein
MVLDSDSFIYAYLNAYVSSGKNETKGYFLKLDPFGNIVNRISVDDSEFSHLYYNKYDNTVYLANRVSLVAFDNSLKIV